MDDGPSRGRTRPDERLGNVLRRSPYWALGATMLCLLVLWDGSRHYVDITNVPSRAWVNLLGLAYVVGAALFLLVYVPRVMAPRAAATASFGPGRFALMRWSFAIAPAAVGSFALMFGGDEWIAALGLGVSFVLLIVLTRDLVRQRG